MEYLDWLHHGNPKGVGDFCEFGVASGNMLITAYSISKMYKHLTPMHFFGFDSFNGLPKTDNVLDKHSGWKTGDFCYGIAEVEKTFKKAGLARDKYTLVPGFFEESLKEAVAINHNIEKISYAHIDCDYYTSTKTVLNFIKPYLVDGAIIDFDDYYCYPSNSQGEPRAFTEWLEENDDILYRMFNRYSSVGMAFTVSRMP